MTEETAIRICNVLEDIEKDLRVIASNSKAFDVSTKLKLDGKVLAEIGSGITNSMVERNRQRGI